MTCYLVTYDVRDVDSETYPALYAELEDLGAVQALESVYLVEFEGTAKALFERLMKHLTDKTKLLVVAIATNNNWWMLLPAGGQWMKKRAL